MIGTDDKPERWSSDLLSHDLPEQQVALLLASVRITVPPSESERSGSICWPARLARPPVSDIMCGGEIAGSRLLLPPRAALSTQTGGGEAGAPLRCGVCGANLRKPRQTSI